jgi:effector-binding domain-containing protein
MTRLACRTAFIALLFCLTRPLAAAEPAEGKKPAAPAAEFLVGEVHYQTLPEVQYLYAAAETTFEKQLEVINKYLPKLREGIQSGAIVTQGSCMFIYKGVNGEDMSKPFMLEIGWVVGDKAKDLGDFKLRKVDASRCATLLFTGRMNDIGKAYEKMIPAVAASGNTPMGEARELFLHWEGADSPNNVVQIQVPVK